MFQSPLFSFDFSAFILLLTWFMKFLTDVELVFLFGKFKIFNFPSPTFFLFGSNMVRGSHGGEAESNFKVDGSENKKRK